MKRIAPPLAAIIPLALAAPAAAVPGGTIGTLEQGRYTCELPGDATGAAGVHVPEADFTVISASSYRANGTLGSYLLTGNRLVMTNGPHRGAKFNRMSRGFLRQVNADGSEGHLRCVLGRRPAQSPGPCPDDGKRSDDPLLRNSRLEGGRQAQCSAKEPLQG